MTNTPVTYKFSLDDALRLREAVAEKMQRIDDEAKDLRRRVEEKEASPGELAGLPRRRQDLREAYVAHERLLAQF